MLYKRSSFLTYLKDKGCDIIPLKDSPVIKIVNGTQSAYIRLSGSDLIDYEEIYLIYNKLLLVDLPGDKDLDRVE